MRTWSFSRIYVIFFVLFVLAFAVHAQNLLINPDAETGDIQGWVDPDDAWSADNVITPHGGAYFFWPARKDIPYTEMYQDVDMTAYSSSIDAGNLWFNLGGWLANWDQYPHDRATLALEALNASGEQLLYVSRDHRSPVWTEYQMEGQIPAGTRTLRVHLIATRFVGYDNDGYFDDLSLTVSNTAPSVYVTVSSANAQTELPVDGTLQLSAETVGGSDTDYIWSSSFDAVATVDTNGLVTAHQAGKFTIQAAGKNTGKTGYIELTAYNTNDIIFRLPKSNEQWLRNTRHEITWEIKGNIASGTLYFSVNGGVDWNEIATIDSIQTGHFFWLVPDSSNVLNNCYLKLAWDGGESVSSKFSIVPELTAIERTRDVKIPTICQLLPVYPNPFNPTTHIKFNLPKQARVNISIYNSVGKFIVQLFNANQNPGTYELNWNASQFGSGIYFIKLNVNGSVQSRKAILIK